MALIRLAINLCQSDEHWIVDDVIRGKRKESITFVETSTVIGCDWSILPLLLATNIYKNKNNENTVKLCFTDTNFNTDTPSFQTVVIVPGESTYNLFNPLNTDTH